MTAKVQVNNRQHKMNFIFEHEKSSHITPGHFFDPDTLNASMKETIKELRGLIGLDKVKEVIYEIYAWIEVNKRRESFNLNSDKQALHMVLTGNPGTGKTTIARILSKLFKGMGLLSKGHFLEVERADLVGEYIGHTAQKSKEWVKKALGGVLFIDEAYSLSRGGEKDFGKEAIDTLVKAMEDHRNDFILILAGYSKEMEQFLKSNSGLISRFPIQIPFPDFTLNQLLEISTDMLKRRDYLLSPQAFSKLEEYLKTQLELQNPNFGNARHIRNILEKAIRHQAVRILNNKHLTKEELMTLRRVDFQLHS